MGCTATKAAPDGKEVAGKTLLTSAAQGRLKGSGSMTPSAESCSSCARTPKSVGHVQGPNVSFGEEFANDQAVKAACGQPGDLPSSSPERLWVIAPMRRALQGEYVQFPAWVVNGEPIWRHTSSHACLFSCTARRWTITDHYSNVEADRGQVRTADPHYQKFPHECSRWTYAMGSDWTADAQGRILVTPDQAVAQKRMKKQEHQSSGRAQRASMHAEQAPCTLWVAAPPRPALQGEYRRVEGRMECGQPVWRRAEGAGWLFSVAGGHWVVGGNDPGGGRSRPQLKTSAPHGGQLPHQVRGWKYARDGTGDWATDSVGAIQVSTDARLARAVLRNYNCGGAEAGSPDSTGAPTPSDGAR